MSNNPLDNLKFTSVQPPQQNQMPMQSQAVPNLPPQLMQALNQYNQNPQAFEQQIAQSNPQGYQEVLRIKNCQNPRAEVLKMAQAKGVPPHILRMFGLM